MLSNACGKRSTGVVIFEDGHSLAMRIPEVLVIVL
jgi:hypothetical protein